MAANREWLGRKEAAEFLQSIGHPISVGRLANLACKDNAGRGPPFRRVGQRRVIYRTESLRTWAEGRIRDVA